MIYSRPTSDGKAHLDRTPYRAVEAYDIPYACLTPRTPGNLLVPVCCSATHVAYCSLRMEPVYMMLGHAAGDAAHLAITGRTTVQEVDVTKLRELLRQEGAVLDPVRKDAPPKKGAPQKTETGGAGGKSQELRANEEFSGCD